MTDDPAVRSDEGPPEPPQAAPPTGATTLPPDPDAYDSPRATQARARGLAAPYIAGGLDPDPEAARREERRYLRILIAFVVILVLSGFILGVIAELLGFTS